MDFRAQAEAFASFLMADHSKGRRRRNGDKIEGRCPLPEHTDKDGSFGYFVNDDGWRAALRRAGVKNFRWHDLRHTFGSRLAQAGVPITAIKELMGHSTVTVKMRYAHLTPGNLQQAVKVLDAGTFLPESAHRSAQPTDAPTLEAG